jgi:hypothetical protein
MDSTLLDVTAIPARQRNVFTMPADHPAAAVADIAATAELAAPSTDPEAMRADIQLLRSEVNQLASAYTRLLDFLEKYYRGSDLPRPDRE